MLPDAWKDLQDDGTVEERLDDINRGQTHRAKLMNEINANKQDYEDLGSEYRRHHADGSSRGRGGGRGGRGGGVIGSRSRSTGRKRSVGRNEIVSIATEGALQSASWSSGRRFKQQSAFDERPIIFCFVRQ